MMRRLFIVLLLGVGLCAHAAEPVRKTFTNGLRAVVVPTTASQVVSIELLLDCSALDEAWPVKHSQESIPVPGLRQVVLLSMLQGSRAANGTAIRRALTAAGGILEGRVQQDVLEFSVTVPAQSLDLGLTALAEIVRRPSLADANVEAAIAQARHALDTSQRSIADTAYWYSQELLYAGHPYATAGKGTEESLEVLSPEIIRYITPVFAQPERAVMAITGRCDAGDTLKKIEAAFGDWRGIGEQWKRIDAKSPVLTASRPILREAQVQSTCVMLTFPVCGATQQDYVVLQVIDTLLGGGTGACLFRSVREEKHLAYEVATHLTRQRHHNAFSLYALSHSRYMDDIKVALEAELRHLQTDPVANDELQRAKAYLKGQYLLGHQSSAQYAFDLAWYEYTGMGIGYDTLFNTKVEAITTQDIQRVARAYFTQYCLVVIIPQTVDSPAQ